MAIQVNIFEAGSVPTAQELATLINELNTTLDESVTLTGEQSITGIKTFLGSKLIKFKQSTSADKLGFTLYDYQGKEVGNFEYDNKSDFRLLALGNYVSTANREVECNIGFKIYNKLQGAAYRLLCPLAGNAKNSIPTLSETYTNFYMPLVFTNGAASVTTNGNGEVNLSSLISSGGSDTSGLAAVATSGDYNDLLNLPALFSGSYNDLTDKPVLFSGDYNDLDNKPIIPVVDLTKAQADELYQPKGNYALTEDLFSGSYNDLTDKPTIPTVPAISTNITNDATSDIKTASPKAVKDFVEGKGYLTQHQDISGKANQSDLESLEDRVDALEQSGGTTQYSYLKLIPDLDAYTEAPVGEIVKYTGQSNNKYTRGWDYEKVAGGGEQITIPAGSKTYQPLANGSDVWNNIVNSVSAPFYLIGTEPVNYGSSTYWLPDAAVGDYVYSENQFYPIISISDGSVTFDKNGSTTTVRRVSVDNFSILCNADHIHWYTPVRPSFFEVGYSNTINVINLRDQETFNGFGSVDATDSEVVLPSTSSWQLIIYPSAPVSSGD